MKTSTKSSGKISCDIPMRIVGTMGQMGACPTTFISYSVPSKLRIQALDVGWGRVKLNMLEGWQNLEMGSDGRRKLDACPGHNATITAADLVRKSKTAEEKAKERAEAKVAKLAEKAELKVKKKQERDVARLKAKQDKADAKAAAKAQARATKKQRSKKGSA